MPKLYEYFGLVVYFYANEHEPIHVHGECQGRESKAEIVVRNGEIVRIVTQKVSGRRSLNRSELKDFRRLVEVKADDIVRRWIDFFVMRKHNPPEIITRKLR